MSLMEGAVDVANVDALLRAAEILECELSTRALEANNNHHSGITHNKSDALSMDNLNRLSNVNEHTTGDIGEDRYSELIRVRIDCTKLGNENRNSVGRINHMHDAVRSYKNQPQLSVGLINTDTQSQPTQWVKMMVDNRQTFKLTPDPNPASVFAGGVLQKRKTAAFTGLGNGTCAGDLSKYITDNDLSFSTASSVIVSGDNGLGRGQAFFTSAVRCSPENQLSDCDADAEASCFSEIDGSYVDSSSQESFSGFNHTAAAPHSSWQISSAALPCDQSERRRRRLIDTSDETNQTSVHHHHHHRLRSVLLNSSKAIDTNTISAAPSSSSSSPDSSPLPANRSLVISLNPPASCDPSDRTTSTSAVALSPPNTIYLYSPSKPPASAPPQLESTSSRQTNHLFDGGSAASNTAHSGVSYFSSTSTMPPSLSCLSSPLPTEFRQRRSSLPVNPSRLPMKKRKLDWSKMMTTQQDGDDASNLSCDDKTPPLWSSETAYRSPPFLSGSRATDNGVTNTQNGSALIIDCPIVGFPQQQLPESPPTCSTPAAAYSQPVDNASQNLAPSNVAVSCHSQFAHTLSSTGNDPADGNLKEYGDEDCTLPCVTTLSECGHGHAETGEAMPAFTTTGLLQHRDCTAKNYSLLVHTLTSPFFSNALLTSSPSCPPVTSTTTAACRLPAKPARGGGVCHEAMTASTKGGDTQQFHVGVAGTAHPAGLRLGGGCSGEKSTCHQLHPCSSPQRHYTVAHTLHLTSQSSGSMTVSSATGLSHRDLDLLPEGQLVSMRDHSGGGGDDNSSSSQYTGNPPHPWLTNKLRRAESNGAADDSPVSRPSAEQVSFVDPATTLPSFNLFKAQSNAPQVLPAQPSAVRRNGLTLTHRSPASTVVTTTTGTAADNGINDCVVPSTPLRHEIPASQTLTNPVWTPTTRVEKSPGIASDASNENKNLPTLLSKQAGATGAPQILMMLSPSVLQEHPGLLSSLLAVSAANSVNKACSTSLSTTSPMPTKTLGCTPTISLTPSGQLDSSVLQTLSLMMSMGADNNNNSSGKLAGSPPSSLAAAAANGIGGSYNFPLLLVSASSSTSAAAVAAAAALATGAPASSLIPVPVTLTTTFVPSSTVTNYTQAGAGGTSCSSNNGGGTLPSSGSEDESRLLFVSLLPGIGAIEY